jgi:hypothetical protein
LLFLSCQEGDNFEFKNEFISTDGRSSHVSFDGRFDLTPVLMSTGKTVHELRARFEIDNEQVTITSVSNNSPLSAEYKESKTLVLTSDLPWDYDDVVITAENGIIKLTIYGKSGTLHLIGSISEVR